MKVSMWNFKEWFEAHHLDCSYRILETRACILSVAFSDKSASAETLREKDPAEAYAQDAWEALSETDLTAVPGEAADSAKSALSQESDTERAWIADAEALPETSGFRTVLFFKRDRILFPTASPAEVMNSALDLLSRMNDWEDRLLDCAMENQDLGTLLDFAGREFPFPLSLIFCDHSTQYRNAAWESPLTEDGIREIRKKALLHSGDNTPFFSHSTETLPGRTLLIRNISYGSGVHAILTAAEKDTPFSSGDIVLMDEIAKIIARIFFFRSAASELQSPLSHWFSRQILDPAHPDLSYQNAITLTSWHDQGCFCVTAVQSGRSDVVPDFSPLSGIFQEPCCHAGCQGKLLILSCLGDGASLRDNGASHPPLPEETAARFLSFLEKNRLQAAFSLPYRGLGKTGGYVQQALSALKLGAGAGSVCTPASSVLKELILSSCETHGQARKYVRPDLLRLANSGRHTQPDDITLLYTYLITGCSATRTSELLFLHRNTLRSRLNELKDALHLTFESENEKKELLLELLLLHQPAGA